MKTLTNTDKRNITNDDKITIINNVVRRYVRELDKITDPSRYSDTLNLIFELNKKMQHLINTI